MAPVQHEITVNALLLFFELVELLDEHGPVSHQSSDGVRGSVSCLADFCDAAHHVLICEAVAVFWVEH